MAYHLSIAGEKSGPFPGFAIIDRIREGSVSREDLVWRQGMAEWLPLGQVDEFDGYWPPSAEEIAVQEEEQFREVESLIHQQPHPWRRFWARMLDYVWYIGLIVFTLGVILGDSVTTWAEWVAKSYIPFEALVMMLYIPIEAWCLSTFGRTPGRILMKLQVESVDGNRASFKQALVRSVHVYVKGLGCWLPLLSLFMMSWSRIQLLRDGVSSWDKACATRVMSKPMERWRYVVLGLVIAFLIIVTGAGIVIRQTLMPPA